MDKYMAEEEIERIKRLRRSPYRIQNRKKRMDLTEIFTNPSQTSYAISTGFRMIPHNRGKIDETGYNPPIKIKKQIT